MVEASGTLIIVPCGRSKVRDRQPDRGAVWADEAYIGAPFVLNRAYAERFGDAWVVLSAKYGFVPPDFEIPGQYEVTFKKPSTDPVSVETLRAQVAGLALDRFPLVVGLGGREYREAVERAFAGRPVCLAFPFAGMPIGLAMQATKRAITEGRHGFQPANEPE